MSEFVGVGSEAEIFCFCCFVLFLTDESYKLKLENHWQRLLMTHNTKHLLQLKEVGEVGVKVEGVSLQARSSVKDRFLEV